MNDPDQLIAVLTGTGEATYFRLDMGTLGASVSYTQKFLPIPIGPIPVQPFVGGSISIEGRLAFGFDSWPQTLAVRSLDRPDDIAGLVDALEGFDAGDILRESFYIDDLDSDGVDVPEIKLITEMHAGAGVSIGIVSAGLKGGIVLTIDLNLADPNRDGRIRIAEVRELVSDRPECLFDARGTLAAFLKFFFEIDLFLFSKSVDFEILRVTFELFDYSCAADLQPANLVAIETGGRLVLQTDQDETFEVRQFDTNGGAAGGQAGGMTVFEVAARGLIQRVEVLTNDTGAGLMIRRYPVATAIPIATPDDPGVTTVRGVSWSGVTFGAALDTEGVPNDWSFRAGSTYDGEGALVTTRFDVPVEVDGGGGADVIESGGGDDVIHGDGGADTIDTGAGDDMAWGGADGDALRGGPGHDHLWGQGGQDKLQGGADGDYLDGGAEGDFLLGGPGRDTSATIRSFSALDAPADPQAADPPGDVRDDATTQVLEGFDTGDVLIGGTGGDTVDGADGSDIVIGGTDTVAMEDRTFEPTLRGVSVRYTYKNRTQSYETTVTVEGLRTATLPSETLLDTQCDSGTGGGAGDAESTDVVSGGPERDILVGGDGPDTLTGGAGPDEICGLGGDDLLVGDTAVDTATTVAQVTAASTIGDDDVIRGGHGDDRVNAGPGDDVVYGDDVVLVRDGVRVLDGTLGTFADGDGNDYLDGGRGADILAGGDGADLIVGGDGNDIAAGEGRDTASTGGDAPSVSERLVDCRVSTRVIAGRVDLNGDLLASGIAPASIRDELDRDDGQLAGLTVDDGLVRGPDGAPFDGLVDGAAVIKNGLVDLDRDGDVANTEALIAAREDTGLLAVPSMRLAHTADGTSVVNPAGDCILGGSGEDALLGGLGSDQAVGGDGKDFLDGGDGHDLLLGEGGNDPLLHEGDIDPESDEGGTDVLLGGPHDDVLVGGDGFDYLAGGPGDDRLRGNNGSDDLIGGSRDAGVVDGQDVLLGGREDDVLVAENGLVASQWIIDEVEPAAWHGGGFNLPAEVETFPGDPALSAAGCAPRDWARWVTLLPGGDEDRVASTPSDPDHDWYDELYGGFDCDWVFGQEGDDLVRGGQDTDLVEGGPGSDTVMGDDGSDVLVGGSSVKVDPGDPKSGAIVFGRSGEGVSDGDDILIGDGGADHQPGNDVLVGDNATADPADGVVSNRLLLADLHPTGAAVHGDDVLIGDEPAGAIPDIGSIDTSDLYACERSVDATAVGHGDWLFGQGGDDCLAGGRGADYLEGNAGGDTLVGGPGDDDIIGGSSAQDGRPMGTDGSRMWMPFATVDAALDDTSAAGLADGDDTASGGDGEDIVLGDNGRIIRPWDESARQVAMADTACGASCGSDMLFGGDGDDILYGQLDDTTAYELPPGDPGNPLGRTQALATGDKLNGEAGSDVLIGDLGIVVRTPAAEVGTERTLTPKGTAITETVYEAGRTIPVTYTSAAMVAPGGADWALGGDGDDVIRLGAGDDIANGDDSWPAATGASLHTGDDVLFGSQGVDTLWGGTGHDHLFGGYGNDLLDVKPRAGDPAIYFDVATAEDTDGPGTANGPDLEYGGWGADELQADFGSTGQPADSDYLIDWIGNHNVYYVCGGALGRGIVIRSVTTDLRSLVAELAKSAGATDVDVPDSGGWFELGLVRQGDQGDNTAPHPSAPGNFTCEAPPAP